MRFLQNAAGAQSLTSGAVVHKHSTGRKVHARRQPMTTPHSQAGPDGIETPGTPTVSNEVSGSAGTVVQAGSVHGGVTTHSTSANSVTNYNVDGRGSKNMAVGEHKHFRIPMPRGLRVTLTTLAATVLVVVIGWAAVVWVMPQFAPLYKTVFLLDTAGGQTGELHDTVEALRKTVGNSGDDDALALRSFGGDCGSPDNTARLVDFATDNRQEITDAARGVASSTGATLLRGVVQATQDFTRPFHQAAKQVNRVVVVTRHGADACDDDDEFVQAEIRDRLAAAGLSVQFRFVGYQVPGDQRSRLDRIATAAGAPPPVFADNPDELDASLDWFTNVEPVLRSAQQVVESLNPAVNQVDEAVRATIGGRLDVAERALEAARNATAISDAPFDDLRSRVRTPPAKDAYDRATALRSLQSRVVSDAAALLEAAQSAEQLEPRLEAFRRTADDYNRQVDELNNTLAALRAAGPGGDR